MKILIYSPIDAETLQNREDSIARARGSVFSSRKLTGTNDMKMIVHRSIVDEELVSQYPVEKIIFEKAFEDVGELTKEVRARLGDWQPEIVMVINGPRWLQDVFPNSLVLHVDSSFLSRQPFEFHYRYDPFGIQSRSFPTKFGNEIKTTQVGVYEAWLLKNFKKTIRSRIDKLNPFKETLQQLRAKHPKIILLALEGLAPWIKEESDCANATEFFDYAMRRIPREAAVIVTQHPNHRAVTADNLAAAQKAYPNLIYMDELEKYHSPSLFLLEYIDVVATISSATRTQANLLWDRNIVGDSKHGINAHFRNAYTFSQIDAALNTPPRPYVQTLYWYLLYYMLPFSLSDKEGFLDKYLAEFLANFRKYGRNPGLYPRIASLSEQIRRIESMPFAHDLLKPEPLKT